MVESIFQSFLLLAFFDMTFMAIAIAVYAISASYLGRESRLSRSRMEKKRLELVQRLREIRETEEIKDIKQKIGEAEAGQRRLGIRIFLLSWLGAVILPSVFFIASFICAFVGLNSEVLWQDPEVQRFLEQQLIIFSSGTLVTGFMIVLFVIRIIDSAAREVPVPEFEFYFADGEKTIKLKRNVTATIGMCIKNKGEDIAEYLQIFVNFPPVFNVHPMAEYIVVKQTAETDYPDYNAAVFKIEQMHAGVITQSEVNLTPPDEKKTYDIHITVYERKIGISKHKLDIEVVD